MQLTPAENEILQKLIFEEEHRNRSEDVLDVLLIILEDEDEADEFGRILELLVQEFENILRHGEFQFAVKLLDHLHKLPDGDAATKTWRKPLIDQFFQSVSDSEVLEALEDYLPDFKSEDPTQLKLFRQVLRMLQPKAVFTLGSSSVRDLISCLAASADGSHWNFVEAGFEPAKPVAQSAG